MVAFSDSADWAYVAERVQRYNSHSCDASLVHDSLLYRIGTHVDALIPQDTQIIDSSNDGLSPEQRYRVLNWLCCQGFKIKGDLALLIFGRNQIEKWLERSRQAYPDFEFYLAFEYLTQFHSGCPDGICFSMHWRPKPGAPVPSVECDFPWKLYWETGSMFWSDWMPNGNQFDFGLSCYPNQQSFATPNLFCVEGDRYTTLTDKEADLMSVARVLEHFS